MTFPNERMEYTQNYKAEESNTLTLLSRLSPRDVAGRITLEVVGYGAAFAVGTYLRLVNLDARPLSPAEAETAAAAWRLLNGAALGPYPSPLLLSIDWIAFFLLGATDLTARLLPALLSSLIVLIPLTVRRSVGQTGALAAAFLIALSPSLVYYSRVLLPSELAVGAALASLIFLWRYVESKSARELFAAAALAAFGLSADSAAVAILLPGLAAIAALKASRGHDADGTDRYSDLSEDPRRRSNPRLLIRAVIIFVVVFVLSATTLFLNREGLGVAFDLFGSWLGSILPPGTLTTPLNNLLVYEPLILLFGAAGIVMALTLRGEEAFEGRVLYVVAAVALFALVWYSISGKKEPADIVAITLPMSLLAGWFIGNLLERAVEDVRTGGGYHTFLSGELPVFLLFLVLIALLYLQVASFLQRSQFSQGFEPLYNLLAQGQLEPSISTAGMALLLVTIVLLTVFVALSILLVGTARTVSLAALAILTILSLGALRTLFGLSFSESQPVKELLVPEQTPAQMRDLISDLEWHSQWRFGDEHVIRLVVDSRIGAVGEWYLKSFGNAVWTREPTAYPEGQAILAMGETPPPGDWIGRRYPVEVQWQPAGLSGGGLWKWLLFREGGGEVSRSVMLWLPPPK